MEIEMSIFLRVSVKYWLSLYELVLRNFKTTVMPYGDGDRGPRTCLTVGARSSAPALSLPPVALVYEIRLLVWL